MNKNCFRFFLLFLPALLLFSCHKQDNRFNLSGQLSFCYWDTFFSLDTALYNATGTGHFYVRYFDVDWDPESEEAKPIASIRSNDSIPGAFTPSVFLTNKVFEKSSKDQLKTLSYRIRKRIENITDDFRWEDRYPEVLIDCDWTKSTQANFFYFVNCLKKDMPDKTITVTLRLWQYKQNQKKDIPPVSRCLLMCYNMQTANDFTVENSIASLGELKKYVSGEAYPLPLDIALPVFNWGVLFRGEKFVGLLGNVDINDYTGNPVEYENLGKGRFRSLIDKLTGNYFIRKGDIIRVEGASNEDLLQMVHYLKSQVPVDQSSRITFFSWNHSYINNHGINEIKTVHEIFYK